MALSDASIKEHIFQTVMARLDQDIERRSEALADYLALTMPNLDEKISNHLATMVPTVLPDLYANWVSLFADSLLKTIPRNQLTFLCDGSEENSATLILIYIMFLESERMEQQIEDDLKSYGLEHSGDQDMGGLVADFLRAKVDQLRESVGTRTDTGYTD